MLFSRKDRLERLEEIDIKFDDLRPTTKDWNIVLSKLLSKIFHFKQPNSILSANDENPFPVLMYFLEKVYDMANIALPADSYSIVLTQEVKLMYEIIDTLINMIIFAGNTLYAYIDKYFIESEEPIEELLDEESRLQTDLDQIDKEAEDLEADYLNEIGDFNNVKSKIKKICSKLNLKSDNFNVAIQDIREYLRIKSEKSQIEEKIEENREKMASLRGKTVDTESIRQFEACLNDAKKIHNQINQIKEDMFQLQMHESETRENLTRQIESLLESIDDKKSALQAKNKEFDELKQSYLLLEDKIISKINENNLNKRDYYSSALKHLNDIILDTKNNDSNYNYSDNLSPYLEQKINEFNKNSDEAKKKMQNALNDLQQKIDARLEQELVTIEAQKAKILSETRTCQNAIAIINTFRDDYDKLFDAQLQKN